MKKEENSLYKFESLTDFHRVFGLPKPLHPMVSFVNIDDIERLPTDFPQSMVLNFYKIAYKTNTCGKVKYGQNYYDFGEGGLVFTAPNQVFESPKDSKANGSLLLVHPDFLLSYPLAQKITDFGFFDYSANEALFLSDKEKETIISIFKIIDEELQSRIDDFSQDVIIAQIELLLNYCNRFYKRQFITRKAVHNDLLSQVDRYLSLYYSSDNQSGMPTVQQIADEVNVSASYLSDMLRSLVGLNSQQYIQNKIIDRSKVVLSTTNLSVSEIAYQLGFEHPQSFSRFFKNKVNMSPLEFRASFN